jgi:hypothetical protein
MRGWFALVLVAALAAGCAEPGGTDAQGSGLEQQELDQAARELDEQQQRTDAALTAP